MDHTFPMLTSLPSTMSPAALVLCPVADATARNALERFALACFDSTAAAPVIAPNSVSLSRLCLERPTDVPVILYPPAPLALAWSLARLKDPAAALKEWIVEAEAILALVRSHRRRVAVIQAGAPVAAVMVELTRLGLAVAGDEPAFPELPPPDPIMHLVADRLLDREARARALAQELEATSRLLHLGRMDADTTAAVALWQQLEAVEAQCRCQEGRLKDLSNQYDEVEALAQREVAARQQAESHIAALLNETTAQRDRLSVLEARESNLVRELGELQEEQAATLAQLVSIQETEATQRAVMEAQLKQLRQGLESGEAQIATLQTEKAKLKDAMQRMQAAMHVNDGQQRQALRSTRAQLEWTAAILKDREEQIDDLYERLAKTEVRQPSPPRGPLHWLRARFGR